MLKMPIKTMFSHAEPVNSYGMAVKGFRKWFAKTYGT
jgi:hypothetical protein